jgi:hypothetical protein
LFAIYSQPSARKNSQNRGDNHKNPTVLLIPSRLLLGSAFEADIFREVRLCEINLREFSPRKFRLEPEIEAPAIEA